MPCLMDNFKKAVWILPPLFQSAIKVAWQHRTLTIALCFIIWQGQKLVSWLFHSSQGKLKKSNFYFSKIFQKIICEQSPGRLFVRHKTFQISVKANYSSIIMPFCGPKLSLCGVILSAWGIVQLVSDEILKLVFEFFKD